MINEMIEEVAQDIRDKDASKTIDAFEVIAENRIRIYFDDGAYLVIECQDNELILYHIRPRLVKV